MESRAYLAWNDPIRWGAFLIEADSICSKHRNKTHRFGAGAQGEILANKQGSPHIVRSATQIAPQINTQNRHGSSVHHPADVDSGIFLPEVCIDYACDVLSEPLLDGENLGQR